VLEPLGGGRRYEVFLVREEELGVEAVAKVLRPDRVDDAGAVNALRREAGLLALLDHPALVRGLDAVLDGPYPHLLLEYLDDVNLKDVVEDHVTLTAGEALSVGVDLLDAVDYLASEGVAHLDVKPSNVVMTDPPRLIDLGAARTLEELADRKSPIGTAGYMAPEQCDPTALGPIRPAADVWGVGATLYHALTGNLPFSKPGPRGSDPIVRYPQLVESPAPIPDYVPVPVAAAVLTLLTRDPGARPGAADAADTMEALAREHDG
jgi:serine/threonine protein kinase